MEMKAAKGGGYVIELYPWDVAAMQRARDLEWAAALTGALGNPPELFDPVPKTPMEWAATIRRYLRVDPLATQWVRFTTDAGAIRDGEELVYSAVAANALRAMAAVEFIPRPTKPPSEKWEPILIASLSAQLILTPEQVADRVETIRDAIADTAPPPGSCAAEDAV